MSQTTDTNTLLYSIDRLQRNLLKHTKERTMKGHDNKDYLGRGILAKKSFLDSAFSKNIVFALQNNRFLTHY